MARPKNPFADASDAETVAAALEEAAIVAVHVGIFDVDAVFRVKRVETAKFLKLLKDGYRFCKVLYNWDTAEVPLGQGDWADEPAPIDPASGRLFPFGEGEAVFVAEFAPPFGDICPRNLLARQVARAREMGIAATAGFEYEYFVLDETDASLREKDFAALKSWRPGNATYSLVPAVESDLFARFEAAMARLDIGFDSVHTEQGPGCLETPLKPAPAMAAADSAGLFKAYARAFFAREDLTATFMAKWSNETNGQSGHLHLSLQDAADGRPLFPGSGDGGLSETARHFVGGLCRLLPETLAMCSHTVNAYRRMVPGIWAPLAANWGIENRTAAIRVIGGTPASTRVEFRVPAADANPHLSAAQALGAGLWGIENRIEPPDPVVGEARPEDQPAEAQLPRTLLEAAERLDASATARELHGDAFVDWFAMTRRHEDAVFRRHVADLDRRRYLGVF